MKIGKKDRTALYDAVSRNIWSLRVEIMKNPAPLMHSTMDYKLYLLEQAIWAGMEKVIDKGGR